MCAKGHRRRGIVARCTPGPMPLGCMQTSGAEEVEKGLRLLLAEPVVQEGLAGKRGTEQSFPALRTEVRVGDTVVNDELIRQGLARVFTQYCNRSICQEWQVLEAEAREPRRGLWSMPNAIPPWEFRRGRT